MTLKFTSQPPLTPYQKHRKQWINCQRCDLCEVRNKVVLLRGMLPAPILFCGEAPGASEDVIGKPFVGPAGHLLDLIIERGIDGQYDYAITNLVGCIPLDDGSKKAPEPPKSSIVACAPRLVEVVRLCQPKVIVMVGRLAEKYVPPLFKMPLSDRQFVKMMHPAAILRMDVSQQGLAVQRCVIALSDVVDDLTDGDLPIPQLR
jgi:DNA polymerase